MLPTFISASARLSSSKIVILALCCWMAAVGINYGSRKMYPPEIQEALQFVPEQSVIAVLSLDNRGLAADLMFIQVLLHSGSLMWKPDRFSFNNDWSYQMIDLATDLDPGYYGAYLFSGMGLLHNKDDVVRATRIIQKGMAIFPDSWELPFWIGFNAYLYLEDDAMASKYLLQAARKPDAPVSFLSLLLSAITKGGNFEQGIWVLETMIQHEKNPKIQRVYKKRIVRLHNFIELQKAAELYRSRSGAYPRDLQELVDSGIIAKIPQDPMGRPYHWNREKQRVETQTRKPVGVLPE